MTLSQFLRAVEDFLIVTAGSTCADAIIAIAGELGIPVPIGSVASFCAEISTALVEGTRDYIAASLNAAEAWWDSLGRAGFNPFLTFSGAGVPYTFPAGGLPMPCVTTHSGGKVQGAGLCCSAVQAGLLTPPPPGTLLPQYVPGSSGTYGAGRITQVTDARGHCASCLIVGSKSRKHPGKPVLLFIEGGPGCPTSGTGCCAMTA